MRLTQQQIDDFHREGWLFLPELFSGEEVEHYLITNHLAQASAAPTDVPLNAPCPPEEHEANVFFRR